jgi:ketosteroid isomerase-like protein
VTDSPRTDFGAGLRQIGMVVDLLRLSATEAVEEIAQLIHPEMQVLAAPGVAPTRPYETREHFLEYFSEARANGVLVQPDAYQVGFAASGAVIVAGSLRMRSRGGDAETPAWFVYTFRDGLIASLETYLSAEMAAQAAGRPTPG